MYEGSRLLAVPDALTTMSTLVLVLNCVHGSPERTSVILVHHPQHDLMAVQVLADSHAGRTACEHCCARRHRLRLGARRLRIRPRLRRRVSRVPANSCTL
jgi:hypothetical protein